MWFPKKNPIEDVYSNDSFVDVLLIICKKKLYCKCIFCMFVLHIQSLLLFIYLEIIHNFSSRLINFSNKKLLCNGCRYLIFISILLIMDTILLLKKKNSQKRHQIYIPLFFLIEMSQSVKKYRKKNNSIQLTLLSC